MDPELKQLNENWNRAWFEKDAALVDRLMGEKYVYVAPDGQVLDRNAILNVISSQSYELLNGTHTEIEIVQAGESAVVVVHRWQGEITFEGQHFKEDHKCTRVWARLGSEWQVVVEQCSPNR